MATPPKSTWSSRSKAPRKWSIRLGPADGSSPAKTDETTDLRWPVVTLAHGSNNTRADFRYALEKNGRRIQDLYLEEGFARQVEIAQVSTDPAVKDVLIFWGEIGTQTLVVSDNSEDVTLRATIEPYHFGVPCLGPEYRDPTSIHDPRVKNDRIVFNPELNGRVEPNRSSYSHDPAVDQEHYFWIHPDSARTSVALVQAQDNATANLWTLADAVRSICWLCNPDQTFIKNPARTDLDSWLADAPEVRNLELPTGRYLPDYLDLMLNPFGYGWAMTFAYNADDEREVSFRVFKLNDDLTTKVLQQKPGDTRSIRFTLTNVEEWKVDTTLTSLSNEVKVLGDFKEFEITVEFYRGWPESEDAYSAADLTQSTGAYWEAHQRAWRLWVANEGGDYCGTRTTVAPIPSTPPDWSPFLGGEYVPRRREPLDCLTHWKDEGSGETTRRRPPFIEWWAPEEEWKPLPNGWGETVLNDQCAVMFAGDAPPLELIARGADARIRMTFTVRSDERLIATAAKQSSSVSLRTNTLTVIADDQFKYRDIVAITPFTSVLAGSPSSDERDDTTEIEAFAEKLRVVEDAAITRGQITLNTLNLALKVGQTISEIAGRNVSLNRMSKTSKLKKYLQILSVTHDHQRQSTILKVGPILEDLV